jgi:hypothetical protein
VIALTHDDGECGLFDAVYVHDKGGTGNEKGKESRTQAPLVSGGFDGFFGNDAMIPVAVHLTLCIHVSMRSLKRTFMLLVITTSMSIHSTSSPVGVIVVCLFTPVSMSAAFHLAV